MMNTYCTELLVLKGRKLFLDKMYQHFVENATKAYPTTSYPAFLIDEYAQNDAHSKFANLGFDKELDRINAEIEFIEHLTK